VTYTMILTGADTSSLIDGFRTSYVRNWNMSQRSILISSYSDSFDTESFFQLHDLNRYWNTTQAENYLTRTFYLEMVYGTGKKLKLYTASIMCTHKKSRRSGSLTTYACRVLTS
jgi:hypothetical protein